MLCRGPALALALILMFFPCRPPRSDVGQDLGQKLNDWETGATIIAHVFYEERMKTYSKLYKVRALPGPHWLVHL